ncbi:MAG: hypothetical protein B6D82_14630, partial [gamma proteobacterium symbiont of Ctena orbiculata]
LLKELQVDILRISPQSSYTGKIVDAFHTALMNEGVSDLGKYTPLGSCNGYWHGVDGQAELNSSGIR